MAELRGHKRGFHRPHDQHRERQGYRRPENRMHPKRWLEPEFDPEGQTDHDRTQHHDNPDRPRIAGIRLTKIQSADGASGLQSQQPLNSLPFPHLGHRQRNAA